MEQAQAERGISQKGGGRLLCWCLLLLSGIVYGSSFSFMKIAAEGGANPLGMVFWFALLAACVLAVELCVTGRLGRPDFNLLKFCIPWSVLSVILPNLCFFYAAKAVQASVIALGIALVPLLTLAGAILLRREALTAQRAAGLALGAIGIMMVLLPKTSLPMASDTYFVVIAFAGAACYAAEHLYIEIRAPKTVGVDQLIFLMFASASILLLPIVLATDTFFLPGFPPTLAEWAVIAVAMITLLDYFLITRLILWAGPVFTSQAAYIVTLAGVIWGAVIFGDSLSIWIWTAICALMTGLLLVRPRDLDRQMAGATNSLER